jgi:acetyl esterase/lipase
VTRPTRVRHPDPVDPSAFLAKGFQEFSYGPSTSDRFYLAIHPQSRKLAFFVHGGGFLSGSAMDPGNSPVIEELWAEGYSVATIGYPLIPDVTWSGAIQAIANGIEAANKLAGRGMTTRVVIGASAGATAGALILYSPDPQYPSLPFHIDRFVGVSGIYISSSVLQNWYSADLQGAFTGPPKTQTPAFLIAGEHDEWDVKAGTPESDPLAFSNYLTQGGVPASTFLIGGADGTHGGVGTDLADPAISAAYLKALS